MTGNRVAGYEPGTVAVATVRGVPNVRVIRDDRKDAWLSGATIEGFQWHLARTQVTDIRPLVVLDLDDPASHVKALREFAPADSWGCLSWLARQIEQQTKPPRIPEPGMWGLVEAHTGDNSTRRVFGRVPSDDDTDDQDWTDSFDKRWRRWGDLIDPTPVREGVTS